MHSILCAYCEAVRLEPNPKEASKLFLGPSAYQYKDVDETYMVLLEGTPDPKVLRRLRNKRYQENSSKRASIAS
jgi:hypothetical protein